MKSESIPTIKTVEAGAAAKGPSLKEDGEYPPAQVYIIFSRPSGTFGAVLGTNGSNCRNTGIVQGSSPPMSGEKRIAGVCPAQNDFSFGPETERLDVCGLTEEKIQHPSSSFGGLSLFGYLSAD